jgi:hypothetical protein
MKKNKYIIGIGYPWYSAREGEPPSTCILLKTRKNGSGKPVILNHSQTGAWRKYKLVLEEL